MSEKIAKFLEKAAGFDGKSATQHWLNCAALSSENTMLAHAYSWMAQRAARPFPFSSHPCCRWADFGDSEDANLYYGSLPSRIFRHLARARFDELTEL